jgi:glyoxylase-like metal-dependent hydrolase (beta-lactamase superfamily II)
MKETSPYTAEQLFQWVTDKHQDFTILDVRTEEEFEKFKVEAPYVKPLNIPYIDFTLDEDAMSERVPKGKSVRVVCSKEGSAKYVAEILMNHGFDDVLYLQGGIKTWGNALVPKLIVSKNDYRFYQFIRPGKGSCSYGLVCNGEMMVFDPSRNVDFYKHFAEQQNVKIVKIFETHLQADYISGSQRLSKDTGAAILCHENDFNGAGFSFKPINHGDTIRFTQGGPNVKIVHTPGHTLGSTSYLIDDAYILTGDIMFISSVGRPDLGGKADEWAKILFNTLKNVIGSLNPSIFVLPAHYLDWAEANQDGIFMRTIKEIKDRNAHIYGLENEADFTKFIKDNMRDQPEVYARIRKFNAGLSSEDLDEQEIMDIGKHECAASKK